MIVDIHHLKFDISQDECDYLMKLPEEDRLAGLLVLRYEFNVLKRGGKKVDPFTLIKIRQALRFAAAFFRVGQGAVPVFEGEKNDSKGNKNGDDPEIQPR